MEQESTTTYPTSEQSAPRDRLICEMEASQRPREKALTLGFDHLTDAELMAIIFATGVKGKSVLSLCEEILEANGNHLSIVARRSVQELCADHKGIGTVKAITLLAALHLGERATQDAEELNNSESITSPEKAYKMMRRHFKWIQHEEFWVMYINRGGRKIMEECVSRGGTAATTVDIKVIMRSALRYSADSLLLFHNHPSGTVKPSLEDDKLTQKIKKAAEYFDIRVNDHIIITDSGFYSYNEHGRM